MDQMPNPNELDDFMDQMQNIPPQAPPT
jgi:hypothetical protein